MRKSRSFLLYRLEPLDPDRLRRIHMLMREMEYDADDVFGFRDIHLADSVLSATLVKRTVTTIPRFEAQTRTLVDQEIFLYSESEFSLDSSRELLEVYGVATDASKVRASLRALLGNEFTLSAVDLAPVDVIPVLAQGAAGCAIESLSISSFRHTEDVVGRYDVRILNSQFVYQAMTAYGHDVTRASLILTLPHTGDVQVSISSAGQARITGDEADLEPAYSHIKAALFDRKG